jgi:hypothetical protein
VPAETYARLQRELEELDAAQAGHSDWIRLSTVVLEAVMQAQSLVIEKQRAMLEAARNEAEPEDVRRLRQEARDALRYVDNMTQLYQRIKGKLG